MTRRPTSLERALEEAVSRALRDNLAPLQRTADELQVAYSDLVAACSSTRPSNALPAMVRAQTAASSLAAGLAVLSNFVAVALNSREQHGEYEADDVEEIPASGTATAVLEQPEEASADVASGTVDLTSEHVTEKIDESPDIASHVETHVESPMDSHVESHHEPAVSEPVASPEPHAEFHEEAAVSEEVAPPAEAVAEAPAFEVASLPTDLQDLHRRANRVAKVAMQDIQLLRPKDVRLGRENNDLCDRLRSDLDKARKEYDRRFRAIQDHPVDYFHRWMVEILAGGDEKALGEYPYPSPVLRH